MFPWRLLRHLTIEGQPLVQRRLQVLEQAPRQKLLLLQFVEVGPPPAPTVRSSTAKGTVNGNVARLHHELDLR